MQNSGSQQRFLIRIILIGSVISACSQLPAGIPNPGNAGEQNVADATPTPTPAPGVQGVSTPEVKVTPALPSGGVIDLRFIDPLSQEECTAEFPFEIFWGEETSISGGGTIDCAIAVQQCGDGGCVTLHSVYSYDGALNGTVLASSENFPEGALDAGLAGTLTLKQYWTDIPPDAIPVFTEDQPFEVSSDDVIPLLFQFIDGATQEVGNSNVPNSEPWIFTLHLE